MSREAMKLALRVALENLDSMESLGPTTEAVIDAAQQWYLAEQPAQQEPNIKSYLEKDNSQPMKLSDYEPDGMHHNKPQKRPQNCGTGYCSCIECVMEPAQQEPVAYAVYHRMGGGKSLHWPEQHSPDGDASKYQLVPLFAQRTWVSLTDKEIGVLWFEANDQDNSMIKHFARAIEAKLKEKNNG